MDTFLDRISLSSYHFSTTQLRYKGGELKMQILKSVCSFNLLHGNVCSRPSRYWTCFLSVLLQRISRLQMLSICAKTNEKKCEEEWYVTFAWRNSFISSFHLRKPPTNLIDLINPFSAPYLFFPFFFFASIDTLQRANFGCSRFLETSLLTAESLLPEKSFRVFFLLLRPVGFSALCGYFLRSSLLARSLRKR